jgi:exosome complex RNA-binding protein Rrp42 (RNase PH superfamily)
MIRLDGRKFNEARPIKISHNLIISASSSTQLSIGSTTVIVAVFNKITTGTTKKKLELEIDSFDQMCTTETINLCKVSTDIMVKNNLKFLPGYQVSINVFIIEDDGNLLTVFLNALSQSLKQIKILKSDEIIFSQIGIVLMNKELCIDPTKFETNLLEQELFYAIIYDLKNRKLKIYEVMNLINQKKEKISIDKYKLQKHIIEFGFHLFKLFN